MKWVILHLLQCHSGTISLSTKQYVKVYNSEMSVHVAIGCNELAYHIQKLEQAKVYVIRYNGYAFLLS